jgi:hypothetical protein
VVDVEEEGEKVEVLDSREAIRGRLKKKNQILDSDTMTGKIRERERYSCISCYWNCYTPQLI